MTKLTGASYVKIALILLLGLLLIGAVGFEGVAGCTLRGLSFDGTTEAGNVSLLLPENDGFTARVDKASGSFESTFSMTQNGSLYVYGQGGSSIDVDLASGTFRLEKS